MALGFDQTHRYVDSSYGWHRDASQGLYRKGFPVDHGRARRVVKQPMTARLIDRLMSCHIGKQYFFFIPQIVALLILPFAWMALDRTPPLILHDGTITPAIVRPGQSGIQVEWRAKFSGRDCEGLSQREVVDARLNLWPQLARARKGNFIADEGNPNEGAVKTPALAIPEQISAGPATYRVTQFYYCNWLQKKLDWPIVQTSPPIRFEVVK